jgi:hypothetical protein
MGEPCSAPGHRGPLRIKPRFDINDILWVRETFMSFPRNELLKSLKPYAGEDGFWTRGDFDYCYRADETSHNPDNKWRPSIFMPREAARLFLQVKNIKIERVHDITEVDAIYEGVTGYEDWQTPEYKAACTEAKRNGTKPPLGFSPRQRFAHLWDVLNKKRGYGWDKNPWVQAIDFEILEIKKDG